MPTVTLKHDVSEADVVTAIQTQLGGGYTVEAKEGAKEVISVAKSALSTAHVRLERTPQATKAHVHGGGLIIGRIINELVLANKVAKAMKGAPGLAGS